jgi:hypothetical protein
MAGKIEKSLTLHNSFPLVHHTIASPFVAAATNQQSRWLNLVYFLSRSDYSITRISWWDAEPVIGPTDLHVEASSALLEQRIQHFL